MAVVQISKIQVRRGQKYSNTGVPQLSSGEFAWAVDAQELYIGNGSIAEGAPFVGNTRVLTENSNIIELLGGYQFAGDSNAISGTVPRSLQAKLDEYVSVLDFIPADDLTTVIAGNTDANAYFQTAVDQLFEIGSTKFKKKLIVPPGTYRFDSDLYIPSTTFIEGENKNTVILRFGSNNIKFKSLNEDGNVIYEGEYDSTHHPQNIIISGIGVEFTTGQLQISGITDTLFTELVIKSSYIPAINESYNFRTNDGTIFWQNDIEDRSTNNVQFRNCTFSNLPVGFNCVQTAAFATQLIFDYCEFKYCGLGVRVDGTTNQLTNWQFRNCNFSDISEHAFLANYGTGTQFIQSNFRLCGNGPKGNADTPISYIIEFNEGSTNVVTGCSFDRLGAAGVSSSLTSPGLSEVKGGGLVEIIDRVSTDIFISNGPRPLAVFSALNSNTQIEYTLTLGTSIRRGTLLLGVEKDRGNFSLSDTYQYSTGDLLMTEFNFDAVLRNNYDEGLSDSAPDTLVLTYVNPSATGASGSISYSVTYSV